MTKALASTIFGLALVFVGSCGDDGDSGSSTCGAFNACGGTVQPGNYKITGSCLYAKQVFESERFPNCTTGTVELSNPKASGTVALKADMTYTSAVTSKGTAKITLPASCLNFGGLQLTCTTIDMQSRLQAMMPNSEFESITCKGTTNCVCTAVSKESTESETGRWAIAGQTITLTATGEMTGEPIEYCAQGSRLKLNLGDSAMMTMGGIMGDVPIRGSLTLTKQ